MQAIDFIFTDNLRRIMCKQYIFQLILLSIIIRNSLIKFRFGINPIAVHSLRYKTHAYIDTICPLCRAAVEDEAHFTLSCSALRLITRQNLQPAKFI